MNIVFRLRFVICVALLAVTQFNGFASEKLIIDGSTGVKPLVESLVKEYRQSQKTLPIEIGKGLKPQARIRALMDKQIDIAMASHGIDIQQISIHGLTVHRIAKMAVVMGVNQAVNVSSVSHQQLCDIYSGKITNWRHLGDSDSRITPFIRPFDEVDTEVLVAHIPCFSRLQVSEDIQVMAKSGQMAKAIANTHSAIGMTTLVRVAQSKSNIKALAINDVTPESANLISGAYPLSRDSFLITVARPDKEVKAFLAFVRSEKGKEIILLNNAVPVNK